MDINEIKAKYNLTADIHMHTNHSTLGPYRHASGSIMDLAKSASEKGIPIIGITDHGPGHFLYGVSVNEVAGMRKEAEKAMKAYPDVKIYIGVEANFKDTPNGLDISPEELKLYDFVNAGYHYGVKNSGMMQNVLTNIGILGGKAWYRRKVKNTDTVLRAISNNDIVAITHPGDKAPFFMDELYEACEKAGVLLEINARHKHMTVDEIRAAAGYDVSFIIGSDAHRPEKLGRYADTVKRAMDAGLDLTRIVNLKER